MRTMAYIRLTGGTQKCSHRRPSKALRNPLKAVLTGGHPRHHETHYHENCSHRRPPSKALRNPAFIINECVKQFNTFSYRKYDPTPKTKQFKQPKTSNLPPTLESAAFDRPKAARTAAPLSSVGATLANRHSSPMPTGAGLRT